MPRRSDLCQQHIVDSLRACGASVFDLHEVGRGCPDLLVGWRGKTHLVEIKCKTTVRKKTQILFAQEWHGALSNLRDMEDGTYMLTCWRDGLQLPTKRYDDIGAVLAALDDLPEFIEIPMVDDEELEELC